MKTILLRNLVTTFGAAFLCLCVLAITLSWHGQTKDLRAALDREHAKTTALQDRLSEVVQSGALPTFPGELTWTSTRIEDAQIDLQNRVTEAMDGLKISPTAFGATAVSLPTSKDTIAFEVEFEASLEQTYAFMAHLEDLRPPLATHSARFRTAHSSVTYDQIRVFGQMVLWGYWEALP